MHGIRPRQKVTQADWASYMEARAERAQDEMLKRFFNTPMPDPDTPLSEVPMVALDMETTGLDERRHAIVSIGVVPFTLGRISMAQRRYWVVKPPRPLDEESIAYHHITHSEIADAPDLDSVLDELLAVLAGRVVVVHFRSNPREEKTHAQRYPYPDLEDQGGMASCIFLCSSPCNTDLACTVEAGEVNADGAAFSV